jgi:[acyl-carrier-protein] S-malonyltransferase
MGKVAVLFPGQGAQYVGMGQDLYLNHEAFKQAYDKADEALGYKISEICFSGPKETLALTKVTQPAMLAFGVGVANILKNNQIKIDAYAGLSLGEYGALVMAGAIDYVSAVKLVEKRGQYMQEAVPVGLGTMAAIIGLESEQVEAICETAKVKGIVEPANYNCPGQIVIGGEVGAIEYACELANQAGALKAMVLDVSAPFHTSMLTPAKEKLEEELKGFEFMQLNTKVVSSVTADYITSETSISEVLSNQVCSPVKWEETIRKLINDGYDTFITIGPGKSLNGFLKRINKKLKVHFIEDQKTLSYELERLLK